MQSSDLVLKTSIDTLPNECLEKIFDYATGEVGSWGVCRVVCKRWWHVLTGIHYSEKVQNLILSCLAHGDHKGEVCHPSTLSSKGVRLVTSDKGLEILSDPLMPLIQKIFQVGSYKLRLSFHQSSWALVCQDRRSEPLSYYRIGELFKNCIGMPKMDLRVADIQLLNAHLFVLVETPAYEWFIIERPSVAWYTLVRYPLICFID